MSSRSGLGLAGPQDLWTARLSAERMDNKVTSEKGYRATGTSFFSGIVVIGSGST